MMLVEINLLPKKEHKKSSVLIMALIGILFLSISASIILFQGNNYEDRMGSLDKQIESVQKLNEVQQAKLADGDTGSSAAKLQKAVEWAKQYPLETVPLLQNIIKLLPERGFIQDFEYGNTNSVIIKIQFDSSRDAAFYLSSLKESDWIEKVTLLNIVAESNEETSSAGATASLSQEREAKTLPRYSAEYEILFKPEQFKETKEMASKEGSDT
jgi:type IV pilus assembly protein PilN